jgi:hypothetical protein
MISFSGFVSSMLITFTFRRSETCALFLKTYFFLLHSFSFVLSLTSNIRIRIKMYEYMKVY